MGGESRGSRVYGSVDAVYVVLCEFFPTLPPAGREQDPDRFENGTLASVVWTNQHGRTT